MSTHTYKKNEDGDASVLPDKMSVYQECLQAFNASPIQAKKCRKLLSRLLRLFYAGESFPTTENTNLFFSISKLFHNNDPSLRQISYLAIKELSAVSNDILMITASIMKDVQSGDSVYKPDAIRTLSRVLDASTINAADRLFKNSIVDSNQAISSSALVSSFHLLPIAKDVVKRWINEIQESITVNKSIVPSQYAQHEYSGYNRLPQSTHMYQYHALALIFQFKSTDTMSLLKMISQSHKLKKLSNSLAEIQMMRFSEKILSNDSSVVHNIWDSFNVWLHSKSDMVELEAARIILNHNYKFSDEYQTEAILTLQKLLSAPRTVTRFAAVRILNKVANRDPIKVNICNPDLEKMINDSNRSISTYAITTLLKTGNSESVDRLVKSISNFIDEISDEFKIIVIDAIRTLSLKFPEKYKIMLNFLNDVLRDEGGFNFKNSIVEAIFDIIKYIPESKESALEMLCEFIEDCEYTELLVRILNLLGNEGPKTIKPSTYVRYIYNRIVLDNSIVRSSAIISLSKFALINNSDLSKSIKILLERSLQDVDDEVRDRAVLSLKLLESNDLTIAKSYLQPQFKYNLTILETELTNYVNNSDKSSFKNSFDINLIPKLTDEEFNAIQLKEKLLGNDENEINEEKLESNENNSVSDITKYTLLKQQYSSELSVLPEIGEYGELLHSSSIIELTENDTEFVVKAVKHIFNEHIVIEYQIENTLDDIILENVNLIIEIENDDSFNEEFILPIEKLEPHTNGKVYISLSRDSSNIDISRITNSLSYISKDIDLSESDEGYPDEYQIEDLSITPGDYVIPTFTSNFTSKWDELTISDSAVFNLSSDADVDFQSITEKILSTMSMMQVGNNIGLVGKNEILKLFGKSVITGNYIAAEIKFSVSSKGVLMKKSVRGDDEDLVSLIVNYVE